MSLPVFSMGLPALTANGEDGSSQGAINDVLSGSTVSLSYRVGPKRSTRILSARTPVSVRRPVAASAKPGVPQT